MHDIEAVADSNALLRVHFSTLQGMNKPDELTDITAENARLRLVLGEEVGVLSEYTQQAYVDSLSNDINDTLTFKQSYFEKRIVSEQAKLAESRLILKSVIAEQAKRRATHIPSLLVGNVDRADSNLLTEEERALLKEWKLSRISRDLAEAQVYGDRMRNETICLNEVLEPFSEAFHGWLDRPQVEENADFGEWIRQYLKKKNTYVSICRWFERAADVLVIQEE